MTEQKTAVIVGVGAGEGLGAYLCHSAAKAGLHVFIGGRTAARIEAVADAIRDSGGRASAVLTDVTEQAAVANIVAHAEDSGPVDLAIYNAGNNWPGDFLEMEADYFEAAWRVICFGGFLFAQQALRYMAPRGEGCLLVTGASASLRGKPNFGAFTSAKAGLRTLTQSLARQYGPQGIHVAQVIIDGGIAGEKALSRMPPGTVEKYGMDSLVGLPGIADAYMFLYRQPRNAWSHELDLRTHKESF